jgi:hypothetical protein
VNRRRLAAVSAVLLGAFAILFAAGRAYRERQAVQDAREALETLGRMEQSYRRVRGEYADDVSALADMTDDWGAFMGALDAVLDLRAGFEIALVPGGYRITARARDRRRTVVVHEGPPRKGIVEASKAR